LIFPAPSPRTILNFSVSDVPLGPTEPIASWSKVAYFFNVTIRPAQGNRDF
jgi:hypothetical protein